MNRRILVFVFLSLALHLGLFLAAAEKIDININSEQGSSPLKISLLREDSPPNKTTKKKTTEKYTPQKKVIIAMTTATPSRPKHVQSDIIEKSSTEKPVRQSISNIKSETPTHPDHAKINKILRDELSRHFYYPAVAQRRNWQGKVLIGFTVSSNGDITRVHINSSSGYKILDNAAIDALSKISTGDKFLLALNGHSIEKSIPIIYALASR